MLGDRGDKVARGEDLEVAPDLLVHAAAVEDRSGCRSRARLGRPHLFDRKGVADDVLGEPFHVLALAGEHPTSAVDVEARVNPASQHPGPLGRQQPLVDQKRDHPCSEEFLQGLETGLGHDVEDPRTCKQPVGHQRVQVGVEVQILAEGLNGPEGSRILVLGLELQAERG